MLEFLQAAIRPSVVTRALKVAALITPILTVVNHSSEILALDLGAGFWLQAGLTFIVPYSVSTYSSAMALIGIARERETVS